MLSLLKNKRKNRSSLGCAPGICLAIAGLIGLHTAGTVFAQSMKGVGRYGASFLQVSAAARQVAMGDAFTGLADDINFLRYNIGGLGNVEKPLLGINFHNWIKDTQQGAIGLALPTQFGIIGIDFSYFNEGSITEFDENFVPSGADVTSNDIALTLGYGSFVNFYNRKISLGGALKIVRQNLADQSATALGLDLGVLYWSRFLSYGATIQNFGITKLKYFQREDSLPETYRAGLGVHFPIGNYLKMNMDFDVAWLVEQNPRAYYGSELIINDIIAIRGGYKFHDFEANRWGIGLGLVIPMQWLGNSQTRLDYAYTPLDAFDGSTHRFSLVFAFGTTTQLHAMGVTADAEKELSKLKEELQRELSAAEKARLATEEAEKRTRALEQEMQSRLERVQQIAKESKGKIEVVSEAPSDSVLVSMRINFDFDKALIRPEEYPTMTQVGQILNTYPECKIFISGHTDFIGSDEYNIRLSQRRVDSVIDFLTSRESVTLMRFFMPIGYGELRPIATNATEEGRFRNRRVDFMIYTNQNAPPIPDGSAIKFVEAVDDSTVKITCNGRVHFTDTMMSQPNRIVLDFNGIYLLPSETNIEMLRGPFVRARLGYHPEQKFSRVVIDLASSIRYTIETEDNIIFIRRL